MQRILFFPDHYAGIRNSGERIGSHAMPDSYGVGSTFRKPDLIPEQIFTGFDAAKTFSRPFAGSVGQNAFQCVAYDAIVWKLNVEKNI